MKHPLILLALVFIAAGIVGCGSSTSSPHLVINQYTNSYDNQRIRNSDEIFQGEWLITDSSLQQQLSHALSQLPAGSVPSDCLASINDNQTKSYELFFYQDNNHQPMQQALYYPSAKCDVVINGKDTRQADAYFAQLVSHAIGGPLEPSP